MSYVTYASFPRSSSRRYT